MSNDPIKIAIDTILLPAFSAMGFREFKTRGIYREDSGLLQIIYLSKLRTHWHRVFFGCIPLFDPEAKLSFGEPGGNIRKEVSGANTDASIRSMKAALSELSQTVVPMDYVPVIVRL